jgi:guanylate kinase
VAAYKAAFVLRAFTEAGHDVRVVPTPAALNFVGAATFEALSGNPVTTRAPRPGEVDGEHYWFVDDGYFDWLIAHDGLLEWATYAGNRYGTPKAPVQEQLAAGSPALLEIELQGARQVRARAPEAQLVFLAPPSWAALVSRLAGRGTEHPEVQSRRLALAQAELDAAGEFDVVVVNDDVARAADELVSLLTAPPRGPRRSDPVRGGAPE